MSDQKTAPPPAKAPSGDQAPQGSQAPSQRPKVLIAEDSPVVRRGLENFMEKWGYEAVSTADGKEAWKALLTNPAIRLAILDWNLPELTGMQICHQLRKKRPRPYVYIIIFSARTSTEEQVAALEHGADDYLAKPAKPSLLKARLEVGRRLVEQIPAS